MSRKRYYGLAQSVKSRRGRMSNGLSPNVTPPRVTGAGLAANVFGVYDDEFAELCGVGEEDYSDKQKRMDREGLMDNEPYQLELELFNQEEIEDDLRAVIRRYELALEKMGTYALRWHWLQEDVEKFGQIEKMFKDMQLCRRLCGGGDPNPEDYDGHV